MTAVVLPQENAFRVSNLSLHDRVDVVTTVLPWPPGAYRGAPLAVGGEEIQVEPFGACWPDGSCRFTRIHAPVRILKASSHVERVRAHTGSMPTPFILAASIRRKISDFAVFLRVGRHANAFESWETIEAGHLVHAYRSRIRVPGTTIWAELTLEALSSRDHVRFYLHLGDSDPRDPHVRHDYGAITLEVHAAQTHIWHAPAKVLAHVRTPRFARLILDAGGRWGDGQSLALRGCMLFEPFGRGADWSTYAAQLQLPTLAVATTWGSSKAFGPWGSVPDPPEPLDANVARWLAVQDYRRHRDRDTWASSLHGCDPWPAGPADQSDFSAVVMSLEAHGWPSRLYSIQRSVYQEACRPTHLREVSGGPVFFSDRPRVLIWAGRPHFLITRDRLGKRHELSPRDVRRGHRATSHWWGHAPSHYSINYLCTYAMLTGDRWALSEVRHHAELWMGQHRIRSGSALDDAGSGRAVGRVMQSGALLWLLTGQDRLRHRMAERLSRLLRSWPGRDTAPVRPLSVSERDPRKLGGAVPFWLPWHEAVGVRGLSAAFHVTGDARARDLLLLSGQSMIAHGCWESSEPLVGDAVEWKAGGAPSTLRQEPEPPGTYVLWGAAGILAYTAHASDVPPIAQRIVASARRDTWRAVEWLAVR